LLRGAVPCGATPELILIESIQVVFAVPSLRGRPFTPRDTESSPQPEFEDTPELLKDPNI
ncbi:MAG: hypothetical protein KTR25_03385, partial [Myxococcales bacterium]|nr:hypothetical protein [Myxococcales bacterium]